MTGGDGDPHAVHALDHQAAAFRQANEALRDRQVLLRNVQLRLRSPQLQVRSCHFGGQRHPRCLTVVQRGFERGRGSLAGGPHGFLNG